MLSKLLKYEFRDTARIIPFIYLIVLVLSATVFASKQLGIDLFIVTSSILLLVIGIATTIITFVLVVIRFYRNLYLNEGYLMFTLPVKPGLLLTSKTIVAYIWVLTSYLVSFGAICISLYGFGVGQNELSEIISEIKKYGLEKFIYIIIALFLIATLYLLCQIFFAITFANKPAFHGMGISAAFLIFIATYVILQVAQAIFTVFVPFSINVDLNANNNVSLSNKNMFGFLMESIKGSEPTNFVIGLGGYMFVVIMLCVLLITTGKMMKKSISIK